MNWTYHLLLQSSRGVCPNFEFNRSESKNEMKISTQLGIWETRLWSLRKKKLNKCVVISKQETLTILFILCWN